MRSEPVYPGTGPQSVSGRLTDELLAYEAHMVHEDAEQGSGIDGMPLQQGQSPLTRTKKTDPSVGIRDQMIARLRKELADARAEAETLRQVCQTLAAMLDIVYPEWREIRRADT